MTRLRGSRVCDAVLFDAYTCFQKTPRGDDVRHWLFDYSTILELLLLNTLVTHTGRSLQTGTPFVRGRRRITLILVEMSPSHSIEVQRPSFSLRLTWSSCTSSYCRPHAAAKTDLVLARPRTRETERLHDR